MNRNMSIPKLNQPENYLNPEPDLLENKLQFIGDEARGYDDNFSDSDIDDPKYLISGSILNKENPNFQPNISHQSVLVGGLQDKVRFLKNDTELKLKKIREIENENFILKSHLSKRIEDIRAKDSLIEEYQNKSEAVKNKFTQYEQKNNRLEQEKASLRSKIIELQNEIQKRSIVYHQSESNSKNISLCQVQLNELQNQLAQKEMKLKTSYQERENDLKNEFLADMENLRKELDALKVQNEKLKYDLSDQNINIESLKTQFDDKEYENKALIVKKDKEIKKLNNIILEMEKKAIETENSTREQVQILKSQMEMLQEDGNNLHNELNQKNDRLYELESFIHKLNHDLELLNSEKNENNNALQNKNSLIEQLNSQIDQQMRELNEMEIELGIQKEGREKEFDEYKKGLNEKIELNKQLKNEIRVLQENIEHGDMKIKELEDLITDKFSSMEKCFYKERTKNDNAQKKFKGIIRQMKQKEKNLFEENKNLKDQLNEKDIEKEQIEYHYQNELKNLSLYNNVNPNNNAMGSVSMVVNQNNSIMTGVNLGNTNVNNSFYGIGVNATNYRFDDPKEESQKKALEEFKRLLAKIDEKLDLPAKN